MNEQHIEFADNGRVEEYLVGVLKKHGTAYDTVKTAGRTELIFAGEKQLKDKLICDAVLNFYKFKILTKNILPTADGRAYYALLGALIGLERDTEEKTVTARLSESDIANIDGFFNFCLNDLRESWQNLALLSAKLYHKCRDEEDVYALAIFMLGMDENESATVVIDEKMLYKEGKSTEIALVPYYGDRERDFILTLLSQRPSDVIVNDPTGIPQGVLAVIRALGE